MAATVLDMNALRRARVSPSGPFGVNRLARFRVEAYRPLYEQTSFYPANEFADGPMESKKQLTEVLQKGIKAKVDEGVLVPPDDGSALGAGMTWGS